MQGRKPWHLMIAGATAAGLVLSGCTAGAGANGKTELTMWTHAAGNPEEMGTIKQIVSDFNASQDEYVVRPESFPQQSYNDAVSAAALAGDLPCILDVDAPMVPNWAWAEYLAPLQLPKRTVDAIMPSARGVYDGQLYSVGYWDVSVAIFARESVLNKYNIRIPTMDRPWTRQEFDDALVTLKKSGEFEYPLDIGTGVAEEWWPYAFSPFLQSFGGDLIDRDTYRSAQGVLNGPRAQEFGTWFQDLFQRKLVDLQGSEAREEFLAGDVALSYDGGWNALTALEKYGDDLLFLPPPDLGTGPVTGAGSWQWGVSSNCEDAEGAMEYLKFSLRPEYLAKFSDETAVIPSTEAAAARSKYFSEDGELTAFAEYAEKYALIRPPTPAYPVISSVFDKTLRDIAHGADVTASLDKAVEEIDADIESNDAYGR